jgi:replicative DNA helicase
VTRKELPHSIEAERSVLGAIILDEDCLHQGINELTTEHFALKRHRHIFEALRDLFEERKLVDVLHLKDKLGAAKTLEEVGGVEYILDVVADVASPASFKHHLRIVEEKYLLRRLIGAGQNITDSAYDGSQEAAALVDKAESMIFGVQTGSTRDGLTHISEFIETVYDDIEARSRRQETISGVETGYPLFDELTNGLQRQEFIVLAARPGQGKTAFVLNVAQHIAIRNKHPVAIFSLEMSREALATRLLCAEARVDGKLLRSGKIPAHCWSPLTEALANLSQSPIYVDETPRMSILEMRAKARRAKLQHDIQAMIVDYLQLMVGTGKYDSRQQEVSEISGFLKALAKELDIPVLACAQLSRAPTQRPGKEPVLSDLRESGAIEQDADVVSFIYHPKEKNKDDEEEEATSQYFSDCELIVAKNRNGPVGRIPLRFIRMYTRFEHRAFEFEEQPTTASFTDDEDFI